MEANKKSLLIALVLGDGSLIEQKKYKPESKRNVVLEIQHGYKQEEYIKWKAELCRKATGTLCNVKRKEYKNKIINGIKLEDSYGFRFCSGHRYFKVLRKWLYPNNKKTFSIKYLKYLNALGIAIWYFDDGSTYINKSRKFNKFQGSCEFSLYCCKEEAEEVIKYFKLYWNLNFYLHKRKENQYNIRCYNEEAIKFINIIKPYAIKNMLYKVTIPECYVQEREASQVDDEVL